MSLLLAYISPGPRRWDCLSSAFFSCNFSVELSYFLFLAPHVGSDPLLWLYPSFAPMFCLYRSPFYVLFCSSRVSGVSSSSLSPCSLTGVPFFLGSRFLALVSRLRFWRLEGSVFMWRQRVLD
ncbi:hypothetical protein TGDOM2_397420 [Toxoplasma gondii GAB2-2007-GAL-DOM2]|uniref:Uncharacterized protein n=1 Tax=Toxoplasma gondii GAB2-2007-GAL-DOM2 TaxID=1130820 RepID=A0A086KZ14_TOXGO|nr:hypothetical protein TGDOM2_397420 [Toxoplasma gondii GAB2-2007-GAL-DOM2]